MFISAPHHAVGDGGANTMSIWKETAVAVPALAALLFVALLFVSHAYFGSDEIPSMSVPTTWLGGVTFPAERFIAKQLIAGRASNADEDSLSLEQKPASELTPQARIRSVFAQFGPSGARSAT
jgi:hypothetical protein